MANFYVDNAATGSNNGTSWANAWTSFSSVSGISPGDTIYISGGVTSKTYAQNFNMTSSIRGSSAARVTVTRGVTAGHNGEPIITGTGSGTAVSHMFAGNSIGYFTFSGISVRPSGVGSAAIDLNSCSNWTIDNCSVKLNGNTAIHVRLCGTSGSTERISNCYITDNGNQTQECDGCYLDTPLVGSTFIFENNFCQFFNSSDVGHNDNFQMFLNDTSALGTNRTVIIRNNRLEHASSTGVVKSYNGQNVIIGVADDRFGIQAYVYNNYMYLHPDRTNNNIIFNNGDFGTGLMTARAWNNTIVGSGFGGQINLFDPLPADEIKNNIFVCQMPNSNQSEYLKLSTSGASASWPTAGNINNNCCFRTTAGPQNWAFNEVSGTTYSTKAAFNSATGHDANSLNVNPTIVNIPTDMTIPATSPCVGAGTPIGYFSTDIVGTLRPQGTGWDIGAFEVQIASGATASCRCFRSGP